MNAPANDLAGATVALAVTGSVAAYKAPMIARLLVQAGARVLPLVTRSATKFLGPTTLSGITGESTALDMWDPSVPGELHVTLATRADVILIAPATADVLARLASGRADDLVTATALCARGPVLVAPAMHPRMWEHPATQRNVAWLVESGGVAVVGPVFGEVASGDAGVGRMAEPLAVVDALRRVLTRGPLQPGSGPAGRRGDDQTPRGNDPAPGPSASRSGARLADLEGLRVLVTAGPTHEAIDPVRYLGNRSTGRMGFAIAARAAARGAHVTLIAGPVAISTPEKVERRDVVSAMEMRAQLDAVLGADLGGADVVVMAAAVADFRPAMPSTTKLKKEAAPDAVSLVRNPDLIAELGARRDALAPTTDRATRSPVLVAFALETGDDDAVLTYARDKLVRKHVDLVVANHAASSLGLATNRIAFVTASGATPFEEGAKEDVADRLLDRVVRLRGESPRPPEG